MKLTRNQIGAMYHALKSCQPLQDYRLPDAYEVQFRITQSRMTMGHFDTDPYTIHVSKVANENLGQAFQTVAHEMVHLACEKKGLPDHADHDAEFNALAAKVCDAWGWNFKEF